MQNVQSNQKTLSNQNPINGNRNKHQQNPPYKKTPDAGGHSRTNVSKYLWTHASGVNDASNFLYEEPGHKLSATFDKKK